MATRWSGFVSACVFSVAAAFGQVTEPPVDAGNLLTIASNLVEPVGVMSHPSDLSRLYILGKRGTVSLIKIVSDGTNAPSYTLLPTPVLDLTDRVYWPGNRGMLGFALAPDYPISGHAFVFYTTQERGADEGMIVRYTRSATNPDILDPSTRQLIFVAPIGLYHHGGCLRFGPDGFLYFAKGDEGNIGLLQARNPGTIYGKMLRLDITRDDFPLDENRNYAIPASNPFASTGGGLPEIFAVGFRSPWQFSFDNATDDLWIGDVGESLWEEITCLPSGPRSTAADFGWPSFEGYAPGPFGTLGVDPALITFPAYAYPHGPWTGFDPIQQGCSVTGGYVYRGNAIPAWRGRYFFSDFCSTRIFSAVRGSNGRFSDLQDMTASLRTPINGVTPSPLGNITAFGVDARNELFICELNGTVRKLIPEHQTPIADIGSDGGIEGSDGQINNNDWVVYLNRFFAADPRADLGSQGGFPGSDGSFDNNDFIVFIDAFYSGQ